MKNSKSNPPVSNVLTFRLARSMALAALLLCGLVVTAHAQTEVIYDWNSGNDIGWGHYDPGAGAGQMNTRTFPSDGSGGFGYRQFSPGTACANIITRGGAYRSEQYGQFFESADLINFDSNMVISATLMGARIGPPSPSAPGELT